MTESTAANTGNSNMGTVTQVIGSTLDAEFEPEHMPAIYNGLRLSGTRVIGDEGREEVALERGSRTVGGHLLRSLPP